MSPDPDWIARRLIPLSTARPCDALSPPPDYDLDFDPALSFSPAAVLIGLLAGEEGLSVLLTRRSDALRRHTGQIALPGGRCEPGETAADTALREAYEEDGERRRQHRSALLKRARVDLVEVSTDTGYIDAIHRFFRMRERRLLA